MTQYLYLSEVQKYDPETHRWELRRKVFYSQIEAHEHILKIRKEHVYFCGRLDRSTSVKGKVFKVEEPTNDHMWIELVNARHVSDCHGMLDSVYGELVWETGPWRETESNWERLYDEERYDYD